MEADLVAGSELGRVISRPSGQHSDHRIATGDRMVGEEDQRLARRRNLDRATNQTLRRQFMCDPPVQLGTFQPYRNPVGVSGHSPRRFLQQGPGLIGEPVSAGAREHGQALARRLRWSEIDPGERTGRVADDDRDPGLKGSRTQPGQDIGGTAAEDLRDAQPTAPGFCA